MVCGHRGCGPRVASVHFLRPVPGHLPVRGKRRAHGDRAGLCLVRPGLRGDVRSGRREGRPAHCRHPGPAAVVPLGCRLPHAGPLLARWPLHERPRPQGAPPGRDLRRRRCRPATRRRLGAEPRNDGPRLRRRRGASAGQHAQRPAHLLARLARAQRRQARHHRRAVGHAFGKPPAPSRNPEPPAAAAPARAHLARHGRSGQWQGAGQRPA
ncbi:DUF3982 domain-containing protein [Variovorax sp. RCC_210]|uniref:DUF3982 domain-containing protein n=1 Tax=Variovorax sp. RCC_210 TaxID=3239217 RepID=UPI00352319E1